jgi:hypothetical protein
VISLRCEFYLTGRSGSHKLLRDPCASVWRRAKLSLRFCAKCYSYCSADRNFPFEIQGMEKCYTRHMSYTFGKVLLDIILTFPSDKASLFIVICHDLLHIIRSASKPVMNCKSNEWKYWPTYFIICLTIGKWQTKFTRELFLSYLYSSPPSFLCLFRTFIFVQPLSRIPFPCLLA